MAVTSSHWLPQSGFGGYIGWGEPEAEADYRATGGSGKFTANTTGGPIVSTDPGASANASILSAATKLNEEVGRRFKEFTAAHPFKADEVLKIKKGEAAEQIDPYYNETLSNYLLGVERKVQRGTQDTRDLLTELSAQTASYTEGAQLKLNEARNRAREGYAGVGLFESGARFREEGLLEKETGLQTEDYLRRQGLRTDIARTGQARLEEDIGLGSLTGTNLSPTGIKTLRAGGGLSNIPRLGLEAQQELRNVERQRFTEGETLANRLLREQGEKYVAGFQAALPPEFQPTGSFDLIRQLGIYS